MAAILGGLFLLALILPPYWHFIRPEGLSIAVRILAVIGGAIWLYLASRDVRLTIRRQDLLLLLILLAAAVAINLEALRSVIAWKGDESLHIRLTMALADRIPPYLLLIAPLLAGLTLYFAARRTAYGLAVILFMDLLALVPMLSGVFWQEIYLGRWPFFSYWWLAMAPGLAKLVMNPNHEVLYRIVPVLAAAVLAWFAAIHLTGANLVWRVLWGLAILTIPTVFYYSSVVYFEMPAVALMTLICLQAGGLLGDRFEDVRHSTGWLALLTIGFIKETVVVFLLCFLLCRALFAWQRYAHAEGARPWRSKLHHVAQEAQLALCVLFPPALYAVFRVFTPTGRSLVLDFSKLAHALTYSTLVRSFLAQFGVIWVLFLGGLVLLALKPDRPRVAFYVLVLVATPLFFALDAAYGDFTGYSRFNLYILPVILAGTIPIIDRLAQWNRLSILAVPCAVIAVNVAMSPIYRDGTKKPGWGTYFVPTGEEYYPYDTAILFLSQNHRNQRILFSGMAYPYPYEFYFDKFDWEPYPRYRERLLDYSDAAASTLPAVLDYARENRFDLVLWHDQEQQLPAAARDPAACMLTIFTNDAHRLLLFSTAEPCRLGAKPAASLGGHLAPPNSAAPEGDHP